MREILFRAKRGDNGEWVEGLLTVMWGQYHIINPKDENTAYPINDETVSQYTGLTDKNGSRIWENDIATVPGEDERFVIRWDIEHAAFVIESDTLRCDFDNYGGNELEVVGNVFDNADLL